VVSSCAATEAVAAGSELDTAQPPVERLETMARELIIGLEGPSLETLCREGNGPTSGALVQGIDSGSEDAANVSKTLRLLMQRTNGPLWGKTFIPPDMAQ
jgi:hypothetical protein